MTDQTQAPSNTAPAYSPLTYDPALFREYVQDMYLSAEQQNALLEAVWLVVVGVIDLGFGLHPEHDGHTSPLAADSSSVLDSLSTSKTQNAEDATDSTPIAQRMDS